MFEARLVQGSVLKKIVEAIKDLVNEANLECTSSGVQLQAMDSSHVSLVALNLKAEGFGLYRCDRNISLGLSMVAVSKVLKCAGNDDSVTIKAEDEGDVVSFIFENPEADRISDFELKLMDLETEHLGIPDTEYKCIVTMPSRDFQNIIRDLGVLGDTCTISVNKEGIRFSVKGDMGSGNVMRKHNVTPDKDEEKTVIQVDEPTELTFAMRYLGFFTRATPLSGTVGLHLNKDVPLMVEYKAEALGQMRYYLAPKIDEE